MFVGNISQFQEGVCIWTMWRNEMIWPGNIFLCLVGRLPPCNNRNNVQMPLKKLIYIYWNSYYVYWNVREEQCKWYNVPCTHQNKPPQQSMHGIPTRRNTTDPPGYNFGVFDMVDVF